MNTFSKKMYATVALVVALGSFPSAEVQADSVAVTLTPDPSNTSNNGFGFSLGYEFLANSNMTVTQFGYFVDGTLTESHAVGLYTASGSLLTSTTVMNGDAQIANFAYSAIAPVTLTAGQDYVIAGTSGFNDPYTFQPTAFSTDPNLTFVASAYALTGSGATLAFPMTYDPSSVGYFGPNFEFTTTSVPEPSSLVLGGLAAVGSLLAAWHRRLRRRGV